MSKVYEIVTEKIVRLLGKGIVPWKRPWVIKPPANLISGKPYRGINAILLSITEQTSPYWLTFRQAGSLGGHVKKGEKASLVVFWKQIDRKKNQGEDEVRVYSGDGNTQIRKSENTPPYITPPKYVLRYYNVFNTNQCEGLVHKRLEQPVEESVSLLQVNQDEVHKQALSRARDITDQMPMPPEISHEGQRACYKPKEDKVSMPPLELFQSEQGYLSTLFHELVHSTGHETRLSRKSLLDTSSFGDHSYSQEELVAEIGASFLTSTAGLQNESLLENHAAYIQSWLQVFKNDVKIVVKAASDAQKASDYILGKASENGR